MIRHLLVTVLLLGGICQSGTRRRVSQTMQISKRGAQKWFTAELGWHLADLPQSGQVPDYRIPYSRARLPGRTAARTSVLTGKYPPL